MANAKTARIADLKSQLSGICTASAYGLEKEAAIKKELATLQARDDRTKEQKLAAAMRAAGIELFNDNSYDHKRNAQNNLSGRTHYVDDGTLRYFHARIVAANPVTEGLIFWIIESAARDSGNNSRGFRFVAFDVFGTVLERANIDGMVNSKEQARRAFWAWFNAFDTLAHYSAVFDKQAEKAKKQSAEFKALARMATVRAKKAGV